MKEPEDSAEKRKYHDDSDSDDAGRRQDASDSGPYRIYYRGTDYSES